MKYNGARGASCNTIARRRGKRGEEMVEGEKPTIRLSSDSQSL